MTERCGAAPEPMTANLFHAGNTCPYCQETIEQAQQIVSCPSCASFHHQSCWQHRDGCASYHCDDRVRAAGRLQPELVIDASELADVVPPEPQRPVPYRPTARQKVEEPRRWSLLALASLTVAVLSAAALIGVATGSMALLAVASGLGLLALVLGLISLVVSHGASGRASRRGSAVACIGVLLAALVVVIAVIRLDSVTSRKMADVAMNLQVSDSMPSEAELNRMEPARAASLRANVVVQSRAGGLFGAGMSSHGSGVITAVAGGRAYILTNAHVLGEAGAELDIVFYNGEHSEATVEWTAEDDIDVAVVSCPTLTLGDLEPVRVATDVVAAGEPTFAVGNPMDLYWSYTEGVVSGVRRIDVSGRELLIYQTQTPINYGNSGGGLYDRPGRLVGVNTWIRDKATSEGLNFAISTASILELLGEQLQDRFVRRADADG